MTLTWGPAERCDVESQLRLVTDFAEDASESAVDNWSWRSLPPPFHNQTNLFLLRLAKRRVGLDLDTLLSQYMSLKHLQETERFSWCSARIPEPMSTGRHFGRFKTVKQKQTLHLQNFPHSQQFSKQAVTINYSFSRKA